MEAIAMKHETKSVLIARKKRVNKEDYQHRPCFISFFDENDPHLNVQGPQKIVEFGRVHKVIIEGLDVDYLLPGNDIVINNLKEVEIEERKNHVHVRGVQEQI